VSNWSISGDGFGDGFSIVTVVPISIVFSFGLVLRSGERGLTVTLGVGETLTFDYAFNFRSMMFFFLSSIKGYFYELTMEGSEVEISTFGLVLAFCCLFKFIGFALAEALILLNIF